jgi:hypothetical protein
VLSECVGIEPNLLPLTRMAVLENFELIVGGNLIPFSNMIKIAGLIGLGAFLVMKTKERAALLLEIAGKQIRNRRSFLAAKKTSLGKVFAFSGWFIFCFLPLHLQAGVLGGKASDLAFNAATPPTGAIAVAA